MYLEITTHVGCPIRCRYCPQDTIIAAYRKRSDLINLDLNTFKTCLDKVPREVTICFSGFCEPWLNPQCTRMVLYAAGRGHTIDVFTTLVGMKPEDIDALEKIRLNYFLVHLPSAGGHENITVDDNYVNVLRRLAGSPIIATYHIRGKEVSEKIRPVVKEKILRHRIDSRAGNVSFGTLSQPERKRGVIACARSEKANIMFPNGDVILCCMDWKMQHVLGNLLASDYESLFRGEEFRKVEKGFADESVPTICRYCDSFAYNVDLKAKLLNSFLPELRSIRRPSDVKKILRRIFQKTAPPPTS
jgi:sulfatase maturation enzyme AslB (radical SAM superfamily)